MSFRSIPPPEDTRLTGDPPPLPALERPARPAGSERPIVVEFLVGYAVLWVVLTAATESRRTAAAAAALAASVALAATYLYALDVVRDLGLGGPSTIQRERGT